jgi:hypothetical protein
MDKGKNTLLLILLAGLFCMMASCSFRKSADAAYTASFRSYANGLAEINLQLNPDLNFSFIMTIMPEYDSDDLMPETFSFNGKWYHNHDTYYVQFNPSDTIDLYALVDPAYDPNTNVFVIDNHTLAFPLQAQEVIIWGIVCYRSPG